MVGEVCSAETGIDDGLGAAELIAQFLAVADLETFLSTVLEVDPVGLFEDCYGALGVGEEDGVES